MDIEIIKDSITLDQLRAHALATFGDMVKAVADVERKIMAVGGSLHADAEAVLLDDGSEQKNLWGFNIYPDQQGDSFIEFTSLINIRPAEGNRSMEIEDEIIREEVRKIVNDRVIR